LHAALPGIIARHPCPASLPGILARHPCCLAVFPGSLASFSYGRRPACSIAFIFRLKDGSLLQAFSAINKTLQF
jgi:hypothetical protein